MSFLDDLRETKIYESYKKKGVFSPEQLYVISHTLACFNFSKEQIACFAKPYYDAMQMQQIRSAIFLGLEQEKLDYMRKPEYDWQTMRILLYAFQKGYSIHDVSMFTLPGYDSEQLTELYLSLCGSIPFETLRKYSHPDIPYLVMREMRIHLTEHTS